MSTSTRRRNKRVLIDSQDEIVQQALRSKRLRTLRISIPSTGLPEHDIVGKLWTTTQSGQKEGANPCLTGTVRH